MPQPRRVKEDGMTFYTSGGATSAGKERRYNSGQYPFYTHSFEYFEPSTTAIKRNHHLE